MVGAPAAIWEHEISKKLAKLIRMTSEDFHETNSQSPHFLDFYFNGKSNNILKSKYLS